MESPVDALSDKEKALLSYSYLHFTMPPQIGLTGLANALGYTNPKSCKNALNAICKKLNVAPPSTIMGQAGSDETAKTPTKKPVAKKGKTTAVEDDSADDETNGVEDPTPAPKGRGRKAAPAGIKTAPKKTANVGQKRKASQAEHNYDEDDGDSDAEDVLKVSAVTSRPRRTLQGKNVKDIGKNGKKGKAAPKVKNVDDEASAPGEILNDSLAKTAKGRLHQGFKTNMFPGLNGLSGHANGAQTNGDLSATKGKVNAGEVVAKGSKAAPKGKGNAKASTNPKDNQVKAAENDKDEGEPPAKVARRSSRSASRQAASRSPSKAPRATPKIIEEEDEGGDVKMDDDMKHVSGEGVASNDEDNENGKDEIANSVEDAGADENVDGEETEDDDDAAI